MIQAVTVVAEPAIESETLELLEWPRLATHLASFASTAASIG